jgi:hypothetical protein
MATTAMDYEATGKLFPSRLAALAVPTRHVSIKAGKSSSPPSNLPFYADDGPRYERDQRSASPRPMRDDTDGGRRRSASPATNTDA